MDNTVIILAGGIGSRFGEEIPKQFLNLNGYTLLDLVIEKYKEFADDIIVTLPKNHLEYEFKYKDIVNCIVGGKTRQESCYNAIKKAKGKNVIITEACRPFIKKENIQKCLNELNKCDGVVTISKTVNTVCEIYNEEVYYIYDRTDMYDLTMPQCFKKDKLLEAHKTTLITNATDDIQVLESIYNVNIKTINISFWESFKLTNPEDLMIFKHLLEKV